VPSCWNMGLLQLAAREKPDISLQDLRKMLGGPGMSDEELVLRYVMKGEQEIEAMRAAGRPKQYFTGDQPLLKLLEQLNKCKQVRFVNLQYGPDSLFLQNQSTI